MEERIADIPAIVPLLERLAALTLPLVHMLDPMSVSNIFWALGTLRLSPAGQCHIVGRACSNYCPSQHCSHLGTRFVGSLLLGLAHVVGAPSQSSAGGKANVGVGISSFRGGLKVLTIEQLFTIHERLWSDLDSGSSKHVLRQLSVIYGIWLQTSSALGICRWQAGGSAVEARARLSSQRRLCYAGGHRARVLGVRQLAHQQQAGVSPLCLPA